MVFGKLFITNCFNAPESRLDESLNQAQGSLTVNQSKRQIKLVIKAMTAGKKLKAENAISWLMSLA